MQAFLTVFAALVLLMGLLILLATAIGYAYEARLRLHQSRDKLVRDQVVRGLGRELGEYAYWFTEDLGAWKTLEVLGQHLSAHGAIYVNDLRADWRRAVQAAQAVKEVQA